MNIVRWKFLLCIKVIAKANLIESWLASLHTYASSLASFDIRDTRFVIANQKMIWISFENIDNRKSQDGVTTLYSLLKLYSLHAWHSHTHILLSYTKSIDFFCCCVHWCAFRRCAQRKWVLSNYNFRFSSFRNQINFVFAFAFE